MNLFFSSLSYPIGKPVRHLVLKERANVGDGCSSNTDCGNGMICQQVGDERECRLEAGEACTAAGTRCRKNHYCLNSENGRTCQTLGHDENEECFTDSNCVAGLKCRDRICLPPLSAGPGENCSELKCDEGYYCDNDTCKWAPEFTEGTRCLYQADYCGMDHIRFRCVKRTTELETALEKYQNLALSDVVQCTCTQKNGEEELCGTSCDEAYPCGKSEDMHPSKTESVEEEGVDGNDDEDKDPVEDGNDDEDKDPVEDGNNDEEKDVGEKQGEDGTDDAVEETLKLEDGDTDERENYPVVPLPDFIMR